ncbi:MAG: ATP-binding protein [Dehalococcoidia bacterium]
MQLQNMFRSIQWRIAIPFTFLILLSMGISGFYVVDFVRDERIDDLKSQLEGEALLIAEASLPDIENPSIEELDNLAEILGERIDARVTIIGNDGTVFGDSDEDPASMENHLNRLEVQEALSTGVGESQRYSTTVDDRLMYVAVPVEVNGTVLGVARVALSTTDVDNSVASLQRNVGIAIGVAAAFTILIALYIARSTTRPLKALTNAAKRISAGELEQTIYPETQDESAELAEAFNEMARNLKALFQDLSVERNKLAAVLDAMVDGVVMTDVSGTVVMANPAAGKMFGFEESAAAGRRLIEIIPDHEVDEIFRSYSSTGEVQVRQIEQVPKGRLLQVIVSPVAYHEAMGSLLIFQDLTQVRRLQSVRQNFIANISHELRTPLASIKAVTETMSEGLVNDPEMARQFLAKIDSETDRMTQMVRELAELSRIETGQMELQLAPLDINSVVEECISRLEPQIDRKQINLVRSLGQDLPGVRAENERIQQVLTNLLHNAIKFTPGGGEIRVSTVPEDDGVVVSIADNGVGISPDDLPHVFERFYKADKARSSEGTGLGLAIAKHLVQVHGGRIWAESGPEPGTTFSFKLPLSSET